MITEDRTANPVPRRSGARILFVCNDAYYFMAHRAHIAGRMVSEGWDVHVACGGDVSLIDLRYTLHRLSVVRLASSPFRDAALMLQIARILNRVRPDVLHLITMKPIVFGGLALLMPTVRRQSMRVVATFPGLGRAFEGGTTLKRLQRNVVGKALRLLFGLPATHATFENHADRNELVAAGIVRFSQTTVLSGAGIDVLAYQVKRRRAGRFKVLWASRLIRGKGLTDFAKAATIAHQRDDQIEFVAAGYSDPGHPDNLTEAELDEIRGQPGLRFLGHVAEMPALLATVDALCLPTSYAEGLPRILIEAAASGLPMIASNVPGCRAIIEDGVNGRMLDEITPKSLHFAILELAQDRDLAERMGKAALETIRRTNYDQTAIQNAMIELYNGPDA